MPLNPLQRLDLIGQGTGAALHAVRDAADEIRWSVGRIETDARRTLAVTAGCVLGLSVCVAWALGRVIKWIDGEIADNA
jgi:hypothetical protein